MLFPGKGASLILNEEYRQFLADALHDIEMSYDDMTHDTDPKAVITLLTDPEHGVEGEFKKLVWRSEQDSYGTKAIAAEPYKNGELRVTVVMLNSTKELKLDIREWWTKD